ncbi:Superfamily I DNA and/or RNA helicase (DNA2) [Fructobacillus fructosus]|uniref:AAA domain-containing protein n=1 Tax=Fructobacillus fructosus TaxID=1631 RepID=UPI002D9EE332|nr:Superfamily I DNA and/or RNA helicase (DNA2) [Fructobacillus fructosus]
MNKDINNVLKTWILIEHFNEGLLDVDRKENDSFFYHKARNYQEFKGKVDSLIRKKRPKDNVEVNVYLDILNIESILKTLSTSRGSVPSISEDFKSKSYKYFKLKLSFKLNRDMELEYSENLFFSASGMLYYRDPEESPYELDIDQKEKILNIEIARFFEDFQFPNAFDQVVNRFAKNYDNMYFAVVGQYDNDKSMHSFFTKDLNWARKNIDNNNLKKYLFGRDRDERFIDFNDQKNIKEFTEPKTYPLGRFPSNPDYSLSLMQQTAVNITTNRFDDDTVQGVNGPPGTGKTTLLKDIFSDHVVQQAKLIVDLKDRAIEGSEDISNSRKLTFLNKNIADLEIFVASSNNGAVQNIVTELPELESIFNEFQSSLLDTDYFNSVTGMEGDDESTNSQWGEFSREGGRKNNVTGIYETVNKIVDSLSKNDKVQKEEVYNEFNNLYNNLLNQREKLQKDWLQKKKLSEKKSQTLSELSKEETNLAQVKHKKNELVLEIHDLERDINAKQINLSKFKRLIIKTSFLVFLLPESISKIVRKIKKLKQEQFKLNEEFKNAELKVKSLSFSLKSLTEDLELLTKVSSELDQFDNKLFEGNNNHDDIEIGNPFFNKSFRKKQSELFILSLSVRKCFLREHKSNLKIANDIFYKQDEFKDNPHLLVEAWHWINFTIPVISSTFASFERMFKNFNTKSLGNLFIDEAGQATPQSAVGAILRSKRILALGDPQQLTPVQPMNQEVLNYLAKINNISLNFVAASLSVQDLIDEASKFGMVITDNRIGIPLTVHRRCSSPMFDISNKLSYSGRMVQGKSDSNGKAQWINVSGKAKDKFVIEQEQATVAIIERLTKVNQVSGNSIYIISPFKNVVMKLKKNKRITSVVPAKFIGTVHTFQGKENRIVIFVLGADEQSMKSANWAFSPANLANVAVTRAKEELFVIGDKSLYTKIDNANTMYRMIEDYNGPSN